MFQLSFCSGARIQERPPRRGASGAPNQALVRPIEKSGLAEAAGYVIRAREIG
jgi:hypothetical protein